MKPHAFVYHDPTSLGEVLDLLKQHGSDVKLLAGGQSLVPVMNFRLARPAHVVDLMHVPGLSEIRQAGNQLIIGAMATHAQIERSALVARRCPLLRDGARLIGHLQIRSRGTFGGSIAHADPAAEWPLCLMALGGTVVARSSDGERQIPSDHFFFTYFTTALAPEEMITAVHLDLPAPGSGWSMQEVARRHGDFALVAVAATVTLAGEHVSDVRLAVGGCGGTPVSASAAAAEVLVGERPTSDAITEVSNRVAAMLEPETDLHASADYRQEVAQTLVERALREALQRAAPAATGEGAR